jgi:tRNA threonylcarbamoyladenosine biosynthesis protein TsaE
MKVFLSKSCEETVSLGRSFGAMLQPGDIVALLGNLGSGKTQFVTGICKGLGVEDHVASPTYTLINEYKASLATVIHIDLYRIVSQSEIEELGIEEYFNERYICLIEWAERVAEILPQWHHAIKFSHTGNEEEREIRIEENEKVPS